MDKRKLLIVFLLLVVLVNGCAPVVNNELPRKKSISERMKEKTQDVKEPPVITPLAPPPPVVKQKRVVKVNPLKGKIITVNAINESLSKVLFMIAADTGMNLVVSPEIDINARITLNLNEIPADQALDILMDTAGVYYEVEGSVLRIKSLVTIEYRIPYIKAIAQYESKLGGDIVGGAADNDSISGSFSLSYKNDAARNDVYGTIAEHINKIIFPDVADSTESSDNTGEDGGTDTGNSGNSGTSGDGTITSQGFKSSGQSIQGYMLNIFTGSLTVRTTKPKQEMIKEYIDQVMRDLSRQVLIEARLIEIVLDESHSYGIDWSQSLNGGNQLKFNQNFAANSTSILATNSLTPIGSLAHATQQGTSVFLSFLSRYGDLETLGNPRVRVLNGQSAVISSGNLIPYWEKEVDESTDDSNTREVTYNRVTVLDGIMLGVTPYIHDDGYITLNIVPVSSSVESDKAVYDENSLVAASFPIINLKEAGSIIKVTDGETIVMGGLINNKNQVVENKVPLLGDIPGVGALFRNKTTIAQKRELVIMLKVSIINR